MGMGCGFCGKCGWGLYAGWIGWECGVEEGMRVWGGVGMWGVRLVCSCGGDTGMGMSVCASDIGVWVGECL